MNDKAVIEARIRRLRPHAKFIAVQHSSEFIAPEANLGGGFFTANLYDERIDSNMITTGLGRVMIQNTYIASFAFNLFLCWLYGRRRPPEAAGASVDALLAHNFKKFFAEQIYRQSDRVPARALLLETLLFEQVQIVGVFAAKEADPKLSADADTGANLMSFALSMHELGHYYLATQPGMWQAILESGPEALAPLYQQVEAQHAADFTVEFQCDAHAVIGCLGQYESRGGAQFVLRAVVFAFAAYAAMYSATATAAATAALWNAEPPETMDFSDIAPMPPVDHDIKWAVDGEFLRRAHLVAQLCEAMATARGFGLYGDDGPFPLPATIVDDMVRYVSRVFDCADDNARRMSNLVALALTGHKEGMEYLYLRSKVFRTNRTEPLRV
jgi:hypothetical protein